MRLIKCTICRTEKPENQFVEGICNACRVEHWIPPPTPPMRRPAPCPRCSCTVHVRCRALRERAGTHGPGEYLGFLAATYDYVNWPSSLGIGSSTAPSGLRPIGVIEAYICRNCGLTELYARDPASIPIGPQYATELVETTTEGPYR